MKVLIITPAGKINGTAKTFLNWIKTLHALDHQVFLYTSKGNLANWTESLCEKQYFFEPARFEPSFSRFMGILRIVRNDNIDVVWGVGTTSSLLGSLAGIIGKKYYLNILNVSPRQHVWPMDPNWKYPLAGQIVTVSEHYRELLINESKIPRDYCHFIPARFNLDELMPVFPVEPKASNGKLTVSLFRRFDEEKALGIKSFLAFVEVNQGLLAHCCFRLYGGGDNELEINELVERMNRSGIDITSHGFIKDVQKEMIAADIVVGSERVAIEALLCGRPVCVIGNNGIVDFVSQHNLESFISDNFTGLGNENHNHLDVAEVLSLFKDYEKLLTRCNVQHCRDVIVHRYDAREGVRKLVEISTMKNPTHERAIIVFRILRAIFIMQSVNFRIALFKRLSKR
jgi:glycosyltransferase involved in cell wall biosynthesis